MKALALAFALALGLATPSFAHPVGGHGGVGSFHGSRPEVHRGFGPGFHPHRGYHGGFIGGPYGGPYYGDPCWIWFSAFGWVYACD